MEIKAYVMCVVKPREWVPFVSPNTALGRHLTDLNLLGIFGHQSLHFYSDCIAEGLLCSKEILNTCKK